MLELPFEGPEVSSLEPLLCEVMNGLCWWPQNLFCEAAYLVSTLHAET